MSDKRNEIAMIRGIAAGLIAYAIAGKLGLYLLQLCWSEYDAHSAVNFLF